ncbi:MAG: phosphatidate cytidylyltransferase [Haliscomenobacter sp.]
MAFDALRIRFITSIFFSAVMLTGITVSRITYIALFGIILLLCLWEFLSQFHGGEKEPGGLALFNGMLLGVLPFLGTAALQAGWLSEPVLGKAVLVFVPLLFGTFLIGLFEKRPDPFGMIGHTVTALLYLGIPFALLNLAALNPDGTYRLDLVLGLLLLTWTNDSGAYMVGSKIGKTPFFPRISPKKTWEGIAGAGVLTLGIAAALSYWFPAIALGHWLMLGLLVFVFGSLGDLVESLFKRTRQIKDSGHLLPGHGGFLDRFDGFVFHLPFTATYFLLFVH